jgi:hypothetical protein
MNYNPNHQEEHGSRRQLSPPLNGTPPQKKKIRNDGISALPTPPPSSDYSSVAARLMVRMLKSFRSENIDKLILFRKKWVMIKIVVLV